MPTAGAWMGWGPHSALGAPIAAALQTHRGEISCCKTAETSPPASGSLLPHLEPLLEDEEGRWIPQAGLQSPAVTLLP